MRRSTDIGHSAYYFDTERNQPLRRINDPVPLPQIETVATIDTVPRRLSPIADAANAVRAREGRRAAAQPTGDLVTLTDGEIEDACECIYMTEYQDRPGLYDIAIARAVIEALDKKRGLA